MLIEILFCVIFYQIEFFYIQKIYFLQVIKGIVLWRFIIILGFVWGIIVVVFVFDWGLYVLFICVLLFLMDILYYEVVVVGKF